MWGDDAESLTSDAEGPEPSPPTQADDTAQDAARAYWRARLADAPRVHGLPLDRPRPDRAGTLAVAAVQVDAQGTQSFDALCAAQGVATDTGLLALLALLVARLSGENDLVIAFGAGAAQAIPLRLDLTRADGFPALLDQAAAALAEAGANVPLSLDAIADALGLAPMPVQQRISQIAVLASEDTALPDQAVAPFDLCLLPVRGSAGLDLRFVYAADLFDAPTMQRFAVRYARLLSRVGAGVAVWQSLPLDDAERQLLRTTGTGPASTAAGGGVYARFADLVRRRPEAVAIAHGTTQLSYAELDAQAATLAGRLTSLGADAGSRVAILLERSIALVVAELAVLRCGAVYVPIDPSFPDERKAFMLADSGAVIAIMQGTGALPPSATLICCDLDAALVDGDAALPASVAASDPQAPAYVMYTSGSTGQPKGVVIAQRGIVRLVLDNGYAAIDADDRVAFASNPTFDASTLEVWAPLLNGGCIVIVDQSDLLEPTRFGAVLLGQGVTVLWLTVGLFNEYADALAPAFATLRYLIVGGDALDPRIIARVLERSPPRHLLNGYGPTETTTFALTHAIRSVPAQRSIPIGKPIAETQIYLLDASGELAPYGSVAEIHIGGAGVALGYLNRPELSAERFVPDLFSSVAGALLYRTGDRGRWLADGTLEFHGRDDTQIKLRGYRIELGEIEARLTSHPAVQTALAVVREGARGDKRLLAYFVAPSAAPTPAQLRDHLASVLPDYMLPAAYVRLDAFPLTPNGKIDRRALPAPRAADHARRAYEAPHAGSEAQLAALWERLLAVESVGRNDHFFELGGHSLLAMRLVVRVRAELGRELHQRDVFAHPVLAALAAVLECAPASSTAPMPRLRERGPAPASFAQQRLWFLDRLGAADSAYHVPLALRLRGRLDRDALRFTLQRIVDRHEALRTRFIEIDGVAHQCIDPTLTLSLDVRNLGDDAEASLQAHLHETVGAPFDLVAGPLLRAQLLRAGDHDHVLVLVLHHIVSDGWSLAVLIDEINTLYAAFLQGEADPLPALPLHYLDYSSWQRDTADARRLQEQADYWQSALRDAPPLLDLPTDRPRPPQQDHRGARVEVQFDETLTQALEQLALRHGATLYMTLLASWAALLARLSNQQDIVIGTPTANRGRAEIENLIGFFVDTLALRVDLDGAPDTATLIDRVKRQVLAAQHNQDLTFERVVDLLRPTRSLAYSPLFQVMFAWQNTPRGTWQLPGLALEALPTPTLAAKFDLTLSLEQDGGRIVGALEYATALFDAATVTRHVECWRNLLQAMVVDDSVSVMQLPLLTPEQASEVLRAWNPPATPYPRDRLLHELFEVQAAATPLASALEHRGRRLSYAQLNHDANRLAHRLRALGAGPDARVAICAERGFELVIGLLAVLKAGAAYVPLDPTYPAGRVQDMLEDCEPCALLVFGERAHALLAQLPPRPYPLLDLAEPDWTDQPDQNPGRGDTGLYSGHLAYFIYTSGSTGKPKGVCIEHRNVAALMGWAQEAYTRETLAAVLAATSVCFDLSVFELFAPLCVGGRAVLVDNALDYAGISAVPDLSLINTVPSAMQALVENGTVGASVRVVNLAGEALSRALVDDIYRHTGVTEVYNLYGPSEDTTYSTGALIARDATRPPLIGRSLSNRSVYVLDPAGHPTPAGVVGEIHVAGAGVARGYWKRPELTAERFIADPFSREPLARMYRTGDLGRWNGQGQLEFCGRIDHQIKLRGFRIELGEIEARLAELDGVRDAVVLLQAGAGGDGQLVAYVVADPAQLDPEQCRTHLQTRLPGYMVPAAIQLLDKLPLTPNGKLDRKALPALRVADHAGRAYEAPHDGSEAQLAALWERLLAVESVGRNDHFFELGGHSLLVLRLVARVRTEFGRELHQRDVFAHPVLAALAAVLEQAPASSAAPMPRLRERGPAPASFAQQRLWFLDRLGAADSAYHLPLALRLRGQLDRDALRFTLQRIVDRHEALRTRFIEIDGVAHQCIDPTLTLSLDVRNLGDDTEAALQAQLRETVGAPFDLATGPLLRAQLLCAGDDDHVLLLVLHHIVSDGWSLAVLIDEINTLYAAFLQGEADPLPALPLHYLDYSAWQRDTADARRLQEQADYWQSALRDAPPLLDLPTDRPRPPQQDHRGARVEVEFDEALTQALEQLALRHGATLYMTLLASWAALLARLSNQQDIVIGTPTANRGRAEIENLIGFFVNTLALRVDLDGAPDTATLIDRVKRQVLAAQHNQDLTFERVVDLLRPTRSLAYSPLFQVMFVWQNAPRGTWQLPGLALEALPTPTLAAQFDLTLSIEQHGGRIVGALEYATALFDAATVARHVDCWRNLLQAMVADDRVSVMQLPLLTPAQASDVLRAWNPPATPYPRDRLLHELFEAQAAATPLASALEHRGRRLSYAQLNHDANRLAHRLRALGAGPDARIGICAERGFELMIGLLAVLKAGAAYVPLDPTYPAGRVQDMLEDCEPCALLVFGERAHALLAQLPPRPYPLLDLAEPDWTDQPDHNPGRGETGLHSGHLAYFIYTSGSTGKPKGVCIEHRNVAALMGWAQEAYTRETLAAVLAATSVCFDLSVFELFAPLCAGGRAVLVDNALDYAGISAVPDLSLINTVPSAMQALVENGTVGASVRVVNLAGEALSRALVDDIYRHTGVTEVYNLYGPSEDTTYSTGALIARDATRPPLIGRSLSNRSVYVLDPAGNPTPAGVVGEIHVAGAGVARGYWKRPELTAERFIADPFSREPLARMYRTGDLGRWNGQGQLEFCGRIDHQIKLRGFRIELGEIEARLAELDGVRDAVVLLQASASGDGQLVAYVVADPAQLDPEQCRTHLQTRLPGYMVPAAIQLLDKLPLTPNGKLDRKALALLHVDVAAAAVDDVAPRDAIESLLAAQWTEVLGSAPAGVHSDFFASGGHSLAAMRWVARIGREFGVAFSVDRIFDHPNIASLANVLRSAQSGPVHALVPRYTGDRRRLPLLAAQRSLLLVDQIEASARTLYSVVVRLAVAECLEISALQRALVALQQRHEVLRLRVASEADGSAWQCVEDSAPVPLRVDDVAAADPLAQIERIEQIACSEPLLAFDLQQAPLLRAHLVQRGAAGSALLITLHHLIVDGWSLNIFARELLALYRAEQTGEPAALPPLPIQYGDYAAWQHDHTDAAAAQAATDYWRAQLADLPACHAVPLDRPRPAQQSHRGGNVTLQLPPSLTRELETVGQGAQATLFMVLITAFQALLARSSGQQDIVIGTPAANRPRAELEGLIGYFVNTLVLRAQIDLGERFIDLLVRTRAGTLAAFQHQALPFEQVVQALNPERSTSHHPLFQIFLTLERAEALAAGARLDVGGAAGAQDSLAKFDLSLQMLQADEGLSLTLNYASDLFTAERAQQLLAAYAGLLQTLAAAPTATAAELLQPTPAQRSWLLEHGHGPQMDVAAELPHRLFERQAAQHPQRPAVVFADDALSYAALNAQANRLARHLRALGVVADSRVALLLPRSTDLVLAIVATWKAGGAYVPLDPASPRERLAELLAEAAPHCVLTHHALAAGLDPSVAVVCLDQAQDWQALPADDLEPLQTLDHLAYLIYTSGSTGRPKGVEISQRALLNLHAALRAALGPDAAEAPRVSVNAPAVFDASVKQIVQLLSGATLYPVPEPAREDVGALWQFLQQARLDVFDVTPSLLQLLGETLTPQHVASLPRRLLIGGEPIGERQWRELAGWRERYGVESFNVYGPTECTVDTTATLITHGSAPSIGMPLANVRVYVLDTAGMPVMPGMPGELCIAGAGLARGYRSRDDLTAERFVTLDVFGRSERVYRSGDWVRFRADGALEYFGRIDQQVKLRGFRIELGEIEAKLTEIDGVRDAVVLVQPGAGGEGRLVAYVVPSAASLDAEHCRAHLQARLPGYMVPAAFVLLEKLPLTPNGKLDRKALTLLAADVVEAYVAPATAAEIECVALWQDVLQLIAPVSVLANFFELGGHSLLATRMLGRLRQDSGVSVPLRTLFARPVLRDFAAALAEQSRAAELPPIRPRDQDGDLPLSFAQQRLWFVDQLSGGSTHYNLQRSFSVHGVLDRSALQQALDALVQRHESLRTAFVSVDQEPRQRIAAQAGVTLGWETLAERDEGARAEAVQRHAEAEANRPFALEQGSLLRVRVLEFSATDHVLLITLPHIVADGWSLGLLVAEFGALYRAAAAGTPAALPALSVQYGDYALWQREWMQGAVLERELAYWQRQLEELPQVHRLPLDRPRPAQQSTAGAALHTTLDTAATQAFTRLCREQGATLFMGLHALFSLLLARHSGERDIVVGTPIANREQAELAPLIGCFINTLVLRADIAPELNFRALLARSRQTALDAYAHQQVPFEVLVERLKPERSLAYSPLFQVMLVLQNVDQAALDLGGPDVAVCRAARSDSAQFELTLDVHESSGGLRFNWIYCTDLFEAATVERLAGHFGRLLQGVLADADAGVWQLSLLGDDERAQLRAWNDTAAPYPQQRCIHELFDEQAARAPDAIALEADDATLSYAQLQARANRLAQLLRRRGVGSETLVGVCLDRSSDLVVALLAVLKAGGAYVPLDPDYPPERLQLTLADSRAPVVLTQQRHLAKIRDDSAQVIALDDPLIAAECAGLPALAPSELPGHGSDCLAYLIYTSGSTGVPKGVCIEHRHAAVLIGWGRAAYRDHLDGVLAATSVCFDLSVFELFVPLSAGGRIVLVDNALDFPRIRRARDLRLINTVPSAIKALVEEGLVPDGVVVNLAGEALTRSVVDDIYRLTGATAVYNLYGPSEDTTYSTGALIPREDTSQPLIGASLPNRSVHVLDRHGQPVPVGVIGEVHVGGAAVARGYWDRPELTRERFVPDPFADSPGARLYRTGDLARWRPQGQLEFAGRVDYQIKLRGFRIELGEIEARLTELDGVRDAVVLLQPGAAGDGRLVAYVVADAAQLDAEQCRSHLQARLPGYMVPAAILLLEKLPLTPNGKLDRRLLALLAVDVTDVYAEPATPQEAECAALWRDVLQLTEPVSAVANFFELGGHSLLATRMLGRLRQASGVTVPLRTLFAKPVLRDFAAALGRQPGSSELPPIRPRERDGDLPLSFAQQRLWFVDQLSGGSTHYNLQLGFVVRGALERSALQQALNALVQRHESLRTAFVSVDQQPRQRIAAQAVAALDWEILSAGDEDARATAADARTDDESSAPFSLEQGNLLRVRVLEFSVDHHVLLITLPHIVADGWSLAVLVQELGTLYRAARDGAAATLPRLVVQYGDYALWQREWMQGAVLERELAYWQQQLAGLPQIHRLPLDRPRPPQQSTAGARVLSRLDATTTTAFTRVCREQGATLFMGLHALFSLLLARHSGERDIVVGTPIANREQAELAPLIGCFVNTLVLRADLAADLTFRQLLTHSRQTALDAYAHQQVPFEVLVERLRPERSLSYSPLFQVMLALQNTAPAALDLGAVQVTPCAADSAASAQFELSLSVHESDAGLVLHWIYCTDLFDAATLQRMAGHFDVLLRGVLADADAQVWHLPLLSEAEVAQQLVDWNDTAAAYAQDRCIHDLFDEQAARTPAAVAVEAHDAVLTYAQLQARADRLARLLQRHGAQAGSIVGVCAERSAAFVVAILAALKAGASYLPLDPSYPTARVAYMLHDSGATIVLAPAELHAAISAPGARLIAIDAAETGADDDDAAAPDGSTASDPAYVIYTSGSTGLPKGTLVSHAALANLCAWDARRYGLAPGTKATFIASITFDASVWEIWPSLLAGGTLVAVSDSTRTDPQQLRELLQTRQVSHCFVPTGLLELIADPQVFSSPALRYLRAGGDRLTRNWLPHGSSALLVNLYGPTEATVIATAAEAAAGEPPPPIGRPISNVFVRVLDERRQLLPVGAEGELHIGGAGLAQGYLGRPELTAERFIADPFRAGARLYRTGDRARYRSDGNLEYLGRYDDQVKVRGVRIELGEIENCLLRLPGVQAATVMLREDLRTPHTLVAYVVAPADGVAPTADALRAGLAETLADPMIPASFVLLDALPLTPNGKVDRNALPAPADTPEQGYAAPVSAAEQRLAAVWCELLVVDRVGIDDNFFALGGHSLLITQMIHRLAADGGPAVSVRDIFTQPTIRALAVLLERKDAASPQVTHEATTATTPLSMAQFRIWYVEQLREVPTGEHNMPVVLALRGEVEHDVLQSALGVLCTKHEVLRTRLVMSGDTPLQRVEVPEPVMLPLHDLRSVPADQRMAHCSDLLEQHATRPFDLYHEPPVAAVLVRLDAQDFRLQLNFHHLVFDGWSLQRFQAELFEAYGVLLGGGIPDVYAQDFSYADYVRWQQRWLDSDEAGAQAEFWRDYLADCSEQLLLPAAVHWPRDPAGSSLRVIGRVGSGTHEGLNRLARQHRGSLFGLLYASFALVLSRWSGQQDLNIGIPVSGRHIGGTETLLGNFLNNLPVRTQVDAQQSFTGYLDAQIANIARVLSNQDYPFEKILELAPRARGRDTTPLFQVFFNMVSVPRGEAADTPFTVEMESAAPVPAKFDLVLYLADSGDGVDIICRYDPERYAHGAMEALTRQYLHLLDQVAQDATRRCGDYALGTPAEAGWEPARYWPGAVQDIFRQQALAHPERIAIVETGQEWRYGELLEASTALAAHLRERGVGQGDVVGIVAARRGCLVVAVLATLQCGAAFSLLNPEYPIERVALLSEILQPACLLFAGTEDDFDQSLRERLAALRDCLFVPAQKDALALPPAADFVPAPVTPDQLACITFTSGTTGTPKAVGGIHIGLAGYLTWVPQWLEITPADRFSLFSGLGHDPIQRDMFGPLCNGATLYIPDAEVFAPHLLARWLKEQRITFAHMTPAMAQILCTTDETRFEDLRVTFLTGELLHSDAVRKLLGYNPDMRVLNSYGTTETQRAVTYFEASLNPARPGVVPAGASAPDAVIRVLNPQGTTCDYGEIGDLFIESFHLSRGYRNDPELTAKVMTDLGGGLRRYRTGDIGCRLPDRTVMCLGRRDSQVNIRGFRIETGEIEAQARALRNVKDVVVLPVRRDETQDLALVAYVVPADPRQPERELRRALAAHLKQTLPAYMVPSATVVLAQLPITPNGKLDRGALPPPRWGDADNYVAPVGELEIALAEIWAEVLRIERVGALDNFFDIGGHSMLMVLMATTVKRRLAQKFNLGEMLRCQTIREQAALLARTARP